MFFESPSNPLYTLSSMETQRPACEPVAQLEKYQDRRTGAHFKYEELCAMLLKLYDQREDPETFSQALDEWEIQGKVKKDRMGLQTVNYPPEPKIIIAANDNEEKEMDKLKAMLGIKRGSLKEKGEVIKKLNIDLAKLKGSGQNSKANLLGAHKDESDKARIVSFKLEIKQGGQRITSGNFAFHSERRGCTNNTNSGGVVEGSHQNPIASQ